MTGRRLTVADALRDIVQQIDTAETAYRKRIEHTLTTDETIVRHAALVIAYRICADAVESLQSDNCD